MARKKRRGVPSKSEKELGDAVHSVVLSKGDLFPVDKFLKHAARLRIAGTAVSEIERDDKGVFSFHVSDAFIASIHVAAPYPADALEGPIATSWMWPEVPSIECVKEHRSHVLITLTGDIKDPIRRRRVLTAVTALAAKQPDVMAVYWPDATLIIYPPVFVEMAELLDSAEGPPPLYLWVDLRAFRNGDGTVNLFTTGLASLGHMELEITNIAMEIGDLREWVIDIINYLLEHGPVLKHGQTIGMSAEQKLRIRHCRSRFGHPGKVVRLEP